MADTPPRPPHHRFHIRGLAGTLRLDLTAELSAPWTILFGPSGCGKSTALHALCGLAPDLHTTFERREPDQSWTFLASSAEFEAGPTHNSPPPPVAPERRQLAFAPQQALLFPHLSALENITFAAAVRGRTPASLQRAHDALDLLDLQPLAHRKPAQLSGGERQRVSLARALAVPDTRLVLLDEPFAGVDRALRNHLLSRIRHFLATHNTPALSVTHDVDEALLLQADILRLGTEQTTVRITARGPAPKILADEIQRLRATLQSHA